MGYSETLYEKNQLEHNMLENLSINSRRIYKQPLMSFKENVALVDGYGICGYFTSGTNFGKKWSEVMSFHASHTPYIYPFITLNSCKIHLLWKSWI